MKRLIAFVALLICLAACQKAPQLSLISPASVDLSEDGSSGTITFSANRDWTISTSDSWLSVSPTSGSASDEPVTVTVRCGANTTYDNRTSTVTIKMEELSQTVSVRQPANLGVIVATKRFNLLSDASTIDVEVQANVLYSVTTSVDWIKQIETKGLVSKVLSFSIEENKSYDTREGIITIKADENSVSDQVINVQQAQTDVLKVEKTVFEMPYDGGEIEIKVESNIEFEVKPDVEWIQYVETKTLSNSSIHLKVDENTMNCSREGRVEVTQLNGSLSHVITIIQKGYYLAVDLGVVIAREDGSTYNLYWAECNVGASKPEEYGEYFAWGEVETKTIYYWETTKYANVNSSHEVTILKYCTYESDGPVDNKTVLDPEDDVAHVMLGGKWRMPTRDELLALMDQCIWNWGAKNGINGYEVCSRVNSNKIFLPAGGYAYGSIYNIFGKGSSGGLWTSSLTEASSLGASCLEFSAWAYSNSEYSRYFGLPIRPVTQ